MGCDIHGFIEVHDNGRWDKHKSIKEYVGRNYDMFALLFGVRNYCGFDPIAAKRGLPDDSLATVAAIAENSDYHSATYITAQELAAIDWTRKSSQRNERTSYYRLEDGKEVWEGSFAYSSVLTPADFELLAKGETVVKNNRIYRRDYRLYSEALSSDWQHLIDDMSSLLTRFDGVRLVVWFDS